MLLLKNASVYAPEFLGQRDILMAAERILAVGKNLTAPSDLEVEVIDLEGARLIPGLVDGHAHIAGAGGEGGPSSRTPELQLSNMIDGGVTTIVGCLGTDGYTRTVENLLMKAKGLRCEGMSCWIYTGSYQVPPPTVCGDLTRDLCYIEEVIGAGEIAVADHRSSSPTTTELIKLAKQVRVGGMLGGKAGILHLHMGDGKNPFKRIHEAVENSELRYSQFFPTHVNRNGHIYEDAKSYGKLGPMDITAGSYPYFVDEEIKPSVAAAGFLKAGVPLEHIHMSSDAGGSLPKFDDQGNLVGIVVGMPDALLLEVRDMVHEEKLDLSTALATVTTNPARTLKLKGKGRIEVGNDADLVVIDDAFKPRTVIAKGRIMKRDGENLVKGTFE